MCSRYERNIIVFQRFRRTKDRVVNCESLKKKKKDNNTVDMVEDKWKRVRGISFGFHVTDDTLFLRHRGLYRVHFVRFFHDYRSSTATTMFTTGYWNERCLSYFIGYIVICLEFWYGRAPSRFDNSPTQRDCNRYFK